MLVLARKLDEAVLIGEDIVVKIVEIRGDVVRLGITAPKSIPVTRINSTEKKKPEGRKETSGVERQTF
jgi:carbon storage regulator